MGDGRDEPPDGYDDVERTYDRMAELRATIDEVSDQHEAAHREHYEWPATRQLLPDLAGTRVLDLGCGNGDYDRWLADRGAEVVGIDRSEQSIALARERAGGAVTFHVADIRELRSVVADGTFDLVISQLALDHIERWKPVFADIAAVLRPGGAVVCAVGNPVFDFLHADATNYSETERLDLPWGGLGCHDYRRPFSGIVEPILAAGLRIDRVTEPHPLDELRNAARELYELHTDVPRYLCVRARKPA